MSTELDELRRQVEQLQQRVAAMERWRRLHAAAIGLALGLAVGGLLAG